MNEKDAQKLLDQFKKDQAFRDKLLSDPGAAAKGVGVSLSKEDIDAILKDAKSIRDDVSKNITGTSILEPTLIKIIKWVGK